MPRLPDASDLGPRRIAQGSDMIVQDHSGDVLLDAGRSALDSVGHDLQSIADHDDQFNYGRAKTALLSADIAVRKNFENDPDWATQENRYGEAMKKASEDASSLIRGARSKAAFEQDAKLDIARGAGEIRQQARVKEGEWARSSLDETLQTSRVAALETKDPATRQQFVKGVQDSIDGALEGQYITPEQATNLRQRWTASYGEGFVEVQPSRAEQARLLRNPKGTPAEFIDPEKRANMLQVLEDHMRVEGDRREAKAEHAVSKMQQQIYAGVPATPAAWQELQGLVAGTSVAGEFEDLVKGEKEVQTTLRKPIGEQVRLVQEKDAALKSNGGTLADAANLERLRQAVTKNVALLQNSPLQFAEQRMDAPVTPIDITSVTDKAQQPALAIAMQDRAVQLRTLSKRYGVTVPMRPLLPQEATQFSALLNAASPNQAAALMSSMRDASGDINVFKGVMQQVAPDNPVLAAAGLLAAQRRELVTGNNWFSPDPKVLSQDVAATIIKGQTLLNPTKGEKGADGKPQTKNLYLPEGATLQREFQNAVGDAFADRSPAADAALQAVRAYYVGRASEKGRLASDNKDIDTDIVSEAVRNVVGNVSNYNGNGHVVMPWGMAEDDFNDRIEASVHTELKRRGLDKVIDPDMGSFGLTNTNRDGEYAVTIGRNLKLDSKGQPITVNIRPSDPRDARGYIDRSGG